MSRISKFALKEKFLYMYSYCNWLFYFAVIIFICKSELSEALDLLTVFKERPCFFRFYK